MLFGLGSGTSSNAAAGLALSSFVGRQHNPTDHLNFKTLFHQDETGARTVDE
jgi:hypothetical protein